MGKEEYRTLAPEAEDIFKNQRRCKAPCQSRPLSVTSQPISKPPEFPILTSSESAMSDFTAFENAFQGDIITLTNPHYAKAIERWSINAVRHAKVVAFVKNPADVVLAIRYAKTNKFPIAVRGGGHSPYGPSSSEGGLVIDLSRYLNGVRVDAERKLVYVGGGTLWEAVDKAAIKHGLATVAGTVNDVCHDFTLCMATQLNLDVDRRWRVRPICQMDRTLTKHPYRLTLGGGFGWLSGSYGLTIDNLEQVRC